MSKGLVYLCCFGPDGCKRDALPTELTALHTKVLYLQQEIMKDKLNLWEERDIDGTKPIPILSLAFRVRTFCSLSLAYPWPIFYCPQIYVGIVEIIKQE